MKAVPWKDLCPKGEQDMRVQRKRSVQQNAASKRQVGAGRKARADRLQMKFDRLAGPVTVRNVNDVPSRDIEEDE